VIDTWGHLEKLDTFPRLNIHQQQSLRFFASPSQPRSRVSQSMCIRTINIDTHADGTQIIYETLETCRNGRCSNPRTKEVRRLIPSTTQNLGRYSALRAAMASSPRSSSGIDFMRLPPSPRLTPSPRLSPRHSPTPRGGSDSESRRRRHVKSGIYTYVNGSKVYEAEMEGRRSPHARSADYHHHHYQHHGRTRDAHAVEVIQPAARVPRFVPDAPPPRLSRSSTMPTYQEYVVVQDSRPQMNSSRRMAVPPAPGLSRRASAVVQPPIPTQAPVAPFIYVDTERDREERRRRREDRRASVHGAAQAVSPAAAAVRKELRWEDEERRVQNARIANRPPKVYQQGGEVRGILKTPPTTPTLPTRQTFVRPAVQVVVPERERLAGMRRSMSGVGISGEREATREGARRATREERELKERLAARFVRGPAGNASRVYYPGEGLYKYV
jgi:hypothetical protein